MNRPFEKIRRSALVFAVGALSFSVALAGCRAERDVGVCEPGEVQTCPCPGGGPTGTQSCADDGERWEACNCSVGEDAGQGDADAATEDTVDTVDTMPNRPPSAPVVAISPAEPGLNDPLTCVIEQDAIDPDGDEVSYRFRWTADGADADIDGPTVDDSETYLEQTWRCEVVATDGMADSPTAAASVSVGGYGECPTVEATARNVGDASGQTDLQTGVLSNVVLDGTGSTDPDGDDADLRYRWTLVSRPEGSHTELLPDTNVEQPRLFLDFAGTYEVELRVYDADGNINCGDPALVTIEADTGDGLVIQMTWDTPSDDDQTDSIGTDMDLHYLNPQGTWDEDPWDAYWRNSKPDWGVAGDPADDPVVGEDDSDGAGPEIVTHRQPADRVYEVGVYYYSDRGMGLSRATVRIYIDGTLEFEQSRELTHTGIFWHVAKIDWAARSIEEVDVTRAGFP